MVRETILICSEQAFEDMYSGFVMLMMRGHYKRQGIKSQGHDRVCAGVKPVDRANDALLDFSTLFEIGILWIRGWNSTDGVARVILGHVWD